MTETHQLKRIDTHDDRQWHLDIDGTTLRFSDGTNVRKIIDVSREAWRLTVTETEIIVDVLLTFTASKDAVDSVARLVGEARRSPPARNDGHASDIGSDPRSTQVPAAPAEHSATWEVRRSRSGLQSAMRRTRQPAWMLACCTAVVMVVAVTLVWFLPRILPSVRTADLSQQGSPQSLVAQTGVVVRNQREAVDALLNLGGHLHSNGAGINFEDFKSNLVTDTALQYVKWFPELKSLRLSGTKVTDGGLEHLSGLTILHDLNLYGTQVTGAGLKHLSRMNQLQCLNLNDTQVTDAALEHIEKLTSLQDLGLLNSCVTDAGLKHLKQLTQLKKLCLTGTKVTDAGLQHLTGLKQLETLDLDNTQVTDAGLNHIKGFPRLSRVFLDNTRVSHQGVQQLKQSLPNLVCAGSAKEIASDFLSGGWKPGQPIPISVVPLYDSRGPRVNVGTFSTQLAAATAETILQVVGDMEKKWNDLPVSAMYVAAIRLYDFGHKDDAVYWFYSAKYRGRLFKALLSDSNVMELGQSAFEAACAHAAFDQLAGQWIVGYAFDDFGKVKATIKKVQSESEKNIPNFTLIYPNVAFISPGLWAAQNKEVSASFSSLLEFIDKDADEIKAKRRENGIEGKY